MRIPLRKPRAFRPATAALEARNAVSSLVTPLGLAAVAYHPSAPQRAEAADAGRQVDDGRVATLAPTEVPAPAHQARRPATPAVVVTSSGRESPVTFPTSRVTTSAGSTAILPESSLATSVITLSPVSAMPQAQSGDVAPTAAPDVAVPPPAPSATPQTRASDPADVAIRPMTLAPLLTQAPAVGQTLASPSSPSPVSAAESQSKTETVDASGIGFGSNYAYGSGGVPKISNSQFPLHDDNIQSGVHKYRAGINFPVNGVDHYLVPVGATASFTVFTSTGQNYPAATTTFAWSGGSSYGGYISDDAAIAPPKSMATSTPDTTKATYSFIVDATVTTYTIHVKVTSTDSQYTGGDCEITFESEKPDPATLTPTAGTIAFTSNATTAKLSLSPALTIQATVTTKNFGGNFMFMQIINATRRSSINASGVSTHRANDITFPPPGEDFDGPIIDNYDGSKQTIAYEYKYNGQTDLAGWHLNPGESMPATTGTPPPAPPVISDGPFYSVPATYKGIKVDDNFSTYLMYRPEYLSWKGVWVALAQVDWSWSLNVNNVGGVWPANFTRPQPAPVPQSAPSGGDEFPSWVNTGKNYQNSSLNPPQPGM